MDMRQVPSFLVFVTFLFRFAASSSGGNRKIAQAFLTNAPPSNLIHQDTVEQIWIHCRTELRGITKGIEGLDSRFSDEKKDSTGSKTIGSDVTLLATRKIQEAIADLPPHLKQTLLKCVRTKHFPVKNYEEAEPNTGTLSRRILLRKDLGHKSSLIATDEAQRPFTVTVHASAEDAPGTSPKSKSSTSSPPPPSNIPASPLPPGTPAVILVPSVPANVRSANPENIAPSDSISHKNLIYSVIGLGCVTILLLIALIVVCFLKRNNEKEMHPTAGERVDKPLSNTGSADTSPGSSQLSTGIGSGSGKKGSRPLVAPNNVTTTKSNMHSSSPESQLMESSTVDSIEGGGMDGLELPTPPGKVAAPPPSASSGPVTGGGSAPPPPPPKMPGPKPPPPPNSSSVLVPTPPPNAGTPARPTPLAPSPHLGGSASEGHKTKLKPFFWDKVLANPDHSMVWHHLKDGSFQVDEEMIESLFGVSTAERNKMDRKKDVAAFEPQSHIQIIDPKKAQNLAILLKALNVTTEEVCDAIKEGHELPPELVQTLLKMAPTSDEELKLRLFTGDFTQLGPAEQFLKVLVDIPYAFKRLESLLFMSNLQEEFASLKESFATLEIACKELTSSRLFLKLLEAVLKTGNRMNDGTYRGGAQAFKLNTLLKLSDVKGTDGKTTLLHFVVQEIIRSEGKRAARRAKEDPAIQAEIPHDEEEALDYYRNLGLTVVSGLSNELVNVRKAALIDGDVLTSTVSKLGHSLAKSKEFLHGEMKTLGEDTKFREALTSFVQNAEVDVMWLLEEEKRMMAQVRSTADYFHGQSGKDEGLNLFVIVRDFLLILDKVCKEVKTTAMAVAARTPMKTTPTSVSSSSGEPRQRTKSTHRLVFPTIKEQDANDDFTSSDDEAS